MRLDSAEVRVVDLAMVAPFRTPFGTIESREVVVVVLTIGGRSYYGECASLHAPIYSPDYTEGVSDVLTRHLIPSMAGSFPEEPPQLSRVLDSFVGHQMACLLYTSDAADERSSVDLGGRRIIKNKQKKKTRKGRIRLNYTIT